MNRVVSWGVGLSIGVGAWAIMDTALIAQSLADVARQEHERRKAVGRPSRVYTNDDVRTARPLTTAATRDAGSPAPVSGGGEASKEAGGNAAGAGPQEGHAPHTVQAHGPGDRSTPRDQPADEAGWKARFDAAREQASRSRRLLDAMQHQMAGYAVSVAAGVRLDAASQSRYGEIAREMDRLRADVEKHSAALTTLEEEAREAGVLPGSLR
jgi:hypothetical protein